MAASVSMAPGKTPSVRPRGNMRPMRRRVLPILFAWATLLSLALCLTTLVLWARSQWVTDQWRRYHVSDQAHPIRGREIAVATYRDALAFRLATDFFASVDPKEESDLLGFLTPWSHQATPGRSDVLPFDRPTSALGFLWHQVGPAAPPPPGERIYDGQMREWVFSPLSVSGRMYSADREYWIIAFPWWLLSVLFAIAPLRAVRRYFARPHRPDLCPACGYDLRATPDRCPECGATPGSLSSRQR
jgi:hypothetical protein